MNVWLWIAAALFIAGCIAVVARQSWIEIHRRSEYEEAVARMRLNVLEFQRVIGSRLLPAFQRATEGFQGFARALSRGGRD